MTEIVFKHGGTVDKFIGDSVMAFWGAPSSDPQQAEHALEAARDMLRFLDIGNSRWKKRYGVEIQELAALPKPTVLVVEDDPDLARLYAAVLKSRGFVVTTAVDGVDGYTKATEASYDVVLSDIMMPRESGWDLLARIRNTARLRETKVLLLSHHADMVSRLRSANSGADAYLQKTERSDAIVSAVISAVTPRRDLAAVVAAGAPRFEGNIALIGPQTLLRLLATSSLSGRLAVTAGGAALPRLFPARRRHRRPAFHGRDHPAPPRRAADAPAPRRRHLHLCGWSGAADGAAALGGARRALCRA